MDVKDRKGQVAIFIILIFHVLFLFFAMVINIGLLVHHKINLQNSVDLAAYYGAMKQAENLNAIAHINYQIRQSWKLLNFRYRQLGTAGVETIHPWDYLKKDYNGALEDKDAGLVPLFCINYPPFKGMRGESYCRRPDKFVVPLPKLPKSISFPGMGFLFQGLMAAAQKDTENALNNIQNSCFQRTSVNYYLLMRFILAYKMDIANRKQILLYLANNLSKSKENFKELDGAEVSEGIKQTLLKNLTIPNRESLSKISEKSTSSGIKIFNSLAAGDCKSTSSDPNSIPGWLNENYIYPIFLVRDSSCKTNRPTLDFTPQFINLGLDNYPPQGISQEFKQQIDELGKYIMDPLSENPKDLLYKSSLGFEKNPWCMAYIGVSATTQPIIPFTPFGSVSLTARSFVKPFGGRIGPWYENTWDSKATHSGGGKRTDPNNPPRVTKTQALSYKREDPNDRSLEPDFSRYVGDAVGTRSQITVAEAGKAIHSIQEIDHHWWDDIIDSNKSLDELDSDGDILAWDKKKQEAPEMRNVEISAIAPDQFDISYYSIDPDFYSNYIKDKLDKIERNLNVSIRGDLGSRKKNDNLNSFSIRSQIHLINEPPKNQPLINNEAKTGYYVKSFPELLTSWDTKLPTDYSFTPNRFGKCDTKYQIDSTKNNSKPAPGSCIQGGRTGYSVKFVNGDFLKQTDLDLGGGPKGGIKNPWEESDL